MDAIRKIYGVLNRISDKVQKLLQVLLAVLVLSCAADLLLQVLYRFALVHFVNFAVTWTTEYAQDALIWITYFAVGICYKEGSMASVNFIYDRLSAQKKKWLYYATRIIVVIFLLIGFKFGMDAIVSMSNWNSTNLHLPGYMLYSAPFVGCILMAYEMVTELLGVICGELEPFVGRPPKEVEIELTEEEKKELESL